MYYKAKFFGDDETAAKIAGEGSSETAASRAAWSLLIRALLNMDEFITKN